MRSGKLIDISKSSLISLKAELTRKQEEVSKIKTEESYVKLPPKPKKQIKINPGVEQRNERDIELTTEEVDLLKKSREVLEIKASIYDKCQKGELVPSDGKSHYLVDFKRKSPEPDVTPHCSEESKNVEKEISNIKLLEKDSDSDKKDDEEDAPSKEIDIDEEEWIEYTDCLGRTRTCHHTDLSIMKDRDKSLAVQLNVDKKESQQIEKEGEEENDESTIMGRELLSKDMHLEELRKKWEDQEKKLANKQEIHYEDVLFDEARSHGVGYWAFSTNAEKRAAEQEMFKKVRAETEQRQHEAAALRRRRDEQRQSRLIAARERQRARLGLPPISTEDIKESLTSDTSEISVEDRKVEEKPEDSSDDLQRKLLRAAHVRPWDVGKDGVKEPVMTQQEWIEKKRAERIEEFAPLQPSTSTNIHQINEFIPTLPKRKLILKQNKTSVENFENKPIERNEIKGIVHRNEAIYGDSRGRGVEIPPPENIETHPMGSKRKITSVEDTAAAIEAGLKYLREEHEKTQNAPTRGTYNMI